MSEKLQISIYRIVDGETLETLSLRAQQRSFIEQSAIPIDDQKLQIRLFYHRKVTTPKWKGYANSLAAAGQQILLAGATVMEAFVLFLSRGGNLYAVTGGHGHFVIQDCIDKDFGIDILSRLIKKDDKILKSAREKSLTGGVVGATKYFRKSLNLFDNDAFGKIYQELKANLVKEIFVKNFGFTQQDLDKDLLCVAKSSFRIHKEISFAQLITVIDGCEAILTTYTPIEINSVEKLNKKKDHSTIDTLNAELIKQLWERFQKTPDSVDFDLCPDDLELYLTASSYEILRGVKLKNLFGSKKFEEMSNIDTLFDEVRTLPKKPGDFSAFRKLVNNLSIASFNDDSMQLTIGKLLDHILGDVVCNGQRYFYIDGVWYLIKDAFIEALNQSCNSFVSKHSMKVAKTWPATLKDENEYNSQYIGAPDTIVLDKVTPENIEPCDILWWDNDNIYLCHVKAGFHNTMRDLCSQVTIAANRISQDINSERKFLKKTYSTLKSKIGGDAYFDRIGKQTETISESDFLELFAKKKITFVLAVLDTATTQRDIRDMKPFNSNIAKFSLQELSNHMRMIDIDFRIAQISR
jgi:uncharacterized protein (TIGR04141 family)